MTSFNGLREDSFSRNLLGISQWIYQMIPSPPEGKAFLVGGVVRDILCLDSGPPALFDIDLCLEGDVSKWGALIARQCSVEVIFEPRFGTARFFIHTGNVEIHIDIAMARKEIYPKPGALPVITSSTLLKDLNRRDFSVNAMAWPFEGRDNRVDGLIDPLGGRSDINDGVLRALHTNSFRDDPTRLFRGFRLLSRLSFKWHSGTQMLVEDAILKKSIQFISGARLRREFGRIFLEKDPVNVLERIYLSGLMESLVPAAAWSKRLEYCFMEVCSIIRMLFDKNMASLLSFGWESLNELCHGESFFYLVIFQDLHGEALDRALRTVGLSGKIGLLVKDAILYSSDFSQKEPGPRVFLKLVFRYLMDTSRSYPEENPQRRMERQSSFLFMLQSFVWQKSKGALLSGDDLVQMGLPPGRMIGEILRAIDAMVREGILTSREEALNWVRKEMHRF